MLKVILLILWTLAVLGWLITILLPETREYGIYLFFNIAILVFWMLFVVANNV